MIRCTPNLAQLVPFLLSAILLSPAISGSAQPDNSAAVTKHRHKARSFIPSLPFTHRSHGANVVRDQAIDILWLMSDRYFHVGDYDSAVRMHYGSIALDPQFVEAYSVAAWLLDSMDRTDEALSLLKRGFSINKFSYQLPFDIGFILSRHKKFEEAVKWYELAAQLPAPFWVKHALARAYERVGRLEEALKVWQMRLDESPDDPVVKRNYERVLKLIKEKTG
ncbi:MAG: tetratricopeptide repeat protein [Armatimonadota bacterium]|nr:tetratricopeptide repeat protein [Armatimonadota bacterium]MCX7776840.1 tetratricopeptide repeat protein [Armatimonadota bacterium]MDW8024474.1 tetratricopeptide repeat protein [Armatimonadota bacterium]